jgi:hypothetical protein
MRTLRCSAIHWPGSELADLRPIEFTARCVLQILEARLGNAEFCLLQATGELAVVAREMLGVDEEPDAFVEAECPDRRVVQLHAIRIGHRAEMESAEAVEGRFRQHGRSPVTVGGV